MSGSSPCCWPCCCSSPTCPSPGSASSTSSIVVAFMVPEGLVQVGAPIKNLRLVMAYAEMAPLIDLVGTAVTLELLLEGRILDAAEAKEKGLVTRVVPDAEVAAEVRATAERIADGAPLVARWHKKFARRIKDPRPL